MTVYTPSLPDFTSQDATTYKTAIDSSAHIHDVVAGAFAPHSTGDEVSPSGPDMTITLEAGYVLNGTTLTSVAAQTTGIITAPTTNPRIDRVVIDDTTGSVSVITGAEAASPSAPSITSGKIPVAQILLQTTSTYIDNSMITDERVGFHTTVGDVTASGNNTFSGDNTFTGSVDLSGAVKLSDVASPTWAAQTDDYSLGSTVNTIRATLTGDQTLTGMTGGSDGRIVVLHNIDTTDTLTISDESASSTAANRFALNGDITLSPEQSRTFRYDGTSSRWRDISSGGSGGKLLQTIYHTYSTEVSTTSSIPLDDTIPQNTEGFALTSKAFTPLSATSTFYVSAIVPITGNTSTHAVGALFIDGDANSQDTDLAAIQSGAYTGRKLTMDAAIASSGTSSRTVSVRVGVAAGTLYINDDIGSARFGGTLRTIIKIDEVEA